MSFEQGVQKMEAEEADKRIKAAGEAQEKRLAALEASVESMEKDIVSMSTILNTLTDRLNDVADILQQMTAPK